MHACNELCVHVSLLLSGLLIGYMVVFQKSCLLVPLYLSQKVNMRLLISHCYSLYRCVIWDITSVMLRKSVALGELECVVRVWGLPLILTICVDTSDL